MDFNVRVYKKFIAVVSDSVLHVTFKKLPSVEFCGSDEEEYRRFS